MYHNVDALVNILRQTSEMNRARHYAKQIQYTVCIIMNSIYWKISVRH